MQPGVVRSASRIARIDCANASRRSGSGQWKTMKTKLMSGQKANASRPDDPAQLAAARASSNGLRSKMKRLRMILPSRTVRHSAPGALATGMVSVS